MELVLFYTAAAVALASSALAISRLDATHALLYLIVSLLAVAVIFFLIGAAFAGVLQILVYAGAILVLYVFVVMMLNLGPRARTRERTWLSPTMWIGPGLLAGVLFVELLWVLGRGEPVAPGAGNAPVAPEAVGRALYGPYLLAVELAAMLLLSGLVGAYHLGRDRLVREGREAER